MVSLKDFKKQAKKKRGIKGYSRMRKAELLELLEKELEEPVKVDFGKHLQETEKKKKRLIL